MKRERCSSVVEENDNCCSTRYDLVLRRREDNKEDETTPASFQDFRRFTVQKYPNLAFLGPATMAVYWYRTYLKEDWIRCNVTEDLHGVTKHCKRKKKDKKRHRRKRGGSFLHIPKVLFFSKADKKITIQNILNLGTAGKHYANSYIELYNMIRQYGTFSRNDENGEIHLTGYNCPKLLSLK